MFNKSVNSIVKKFVSVAAELEGLAKEQDNKVLQYGAKIENLNNQVSALVDSTISAQDEAARALKIAAKIRGLLE